MRNLFRRHLLRLSIPAAPHRPAELSGQSLVEFALLFPLLLLILLGAIDLGRAFNAYVTITNASREGARYGATHPTDSSGIQARAIHEATSSGSGLLPSDVTVTVDCAVFGSNTWGSCSSVFKGDQIRVTVALIPPHGFQFLTLFLFNLPQIPMSNNTIMAIIST